MIKFSIKHRDMTSPAAFREPCKNYNEAIIAGGKWMNLIEIRAREREGSRKILENCAQEREKQIAPLFPVPEINQNIFITIDIPQFPALYILPPFFLLCVFVVLSQGGAFARFLKPHCGVLVWTPRPHRGAGGRSATHPPNSQARRSVLLPLPSMHVNVPLSTPVDSDHFHPSIFHSIQSKPS